MKLRNAAPLLLSLVLAGCASTGKTAAQNPLPDAPGAAPPEAAQDAVGAAAEPAAAPPAVEAEGPSGEPVIGEPEVGDPEADEPLAGEPLEAVDPPPTTREALERAVTWANEGVRHYHDGDHQKARESLAAARIALLEADLPEVMQEQGLAVLGCALAGELGQHDLEAIAALLEVEPEPAEELEEHELIEREVRRILLRFGAPPPRSEYLEIFVDEVQRYVDYYRGKGREFFERAYQRKHKYWPTIEEVFSERNIPIELGYMALVESGFNPRARSRANARGLWQFIPATGKRYQLYRVDDFYDVHKATLAASEYLLDLIGIFGSPSFLLATAAYNAGESRIQNCLRDLDDPFGKRSFWEIRDCLARETRDYVPRIMAAAVIGSDPVRFGFDLPPADDVLARYDVVTVPDPTSLAELARRAGTTVAELRTANSDLAPTATSTPSRNFPLYVPKGGGERLAQVLPAAPSDRGAGAGWPVEARAVSRSEARPSATDGDGERSVYRVRSGDTLSEIAARHGVRTRDLASWNGLGSPYRLSIGQELVIRGGGQVRVVYTVQRGNTLSSIADVFAVRYRDIMSWNSLSRSALRVGQKLVIHPPRPLRAETYRVQHGDTVANIARRFGVPVRDVLTVNGLGARSLIRPGDRLVVYVRA